MTAKCTDNPLEHDAYAVDIKIIDCENRAQIDGVMTILVVITVEFAALWNVTTTVARASVTISRTEGRGWQFLADASL